MYTKKCASLNIEINQSNPNCLPVNTFIVVTSRVFSSTSHTRSQAMEEDLIQFDDVLPRIRDVKLPSFWHDKPASWFALAESRFRTYAVTSEQAKFDQLVGSLNKESIGRVLDLVEHPPIVTPYSVLKQRLLEAHQLTDYQKVDQLLKMEALGARKPSELLAAMLETCPRGQETNIFFTHLFLCRLPAELRIMLGEDDHQDVRNLVAKADKLWALHGQKSSLVATVEQVVEESSSIVAAVSGRGRGGRGGRSSRGGRGQHAGVRNNQQSQAGGLQNTNRPSSQQGAGGTAVTASLSPSDLARMGTDLCFFHWSWGDKARSCQAPCSWQGN